MDASPAIASPTNPAKRPRSPSGDIILPATKVPRTHGSGTPINYLSKQLTKTIPLVSADDTLSNVLHLIGEYEGVLLRHESVAANLGACPLGPILLKRFERLFDGPPRILKHHGRDTNITWLDVVEFARNKPEQFNLEKTRNGVRVCQFYTKQSRVEISEEDYVLIASGMPQKLIPPQPILEDEEKELGVLDLLEANLSQVIQGADQVTTKGRQLMQKIRSRRQAIYVRRQHEGSGSTGAFVARSASPVEDVNGIVAQLEAAGEPSQSPPSGFMAVNMRQTVPSESENRPTWSSVDSSSNTPHALFPGTNTENVTIINGKSIKGADPNVRAELMKQFFTGGDQSMSTPDGPQQASGSRSRPSVDTQSTSKKPRSSSVEMSGIGYSQTSPTVAIPHTPASLLPQSKPSSTGRNDDGPFKAMMMKRMENYPRGTRVIPPCDRCRRLHMDCIKNLTACLGCTRKHAKCSWKDVRREELDESDREGDVLESESESDDEEPVNTVARGSAVVTKMFPNLQNRHTSHSHATVAVSKDVESIDTTYNSETSARKSTEPTGRGSAQVDERSVIMADIGSSHSKQPHPHAQSAVEGDDDEDGGDRLQALAARVYRSASQGVRQMDL